MVADRGTEEWDRVGYWDADSGVYDGGEWDVELR